MKPWILALPLILLQGCLNLNPKVQPVHFYALKAEAASNPRLPLQPSRPQPIGVLPIQIPAYLKSNKLAFERTPPEIQYEEYHRWAEPLPEGIARTLADNLRTLFPEGRFITVPWRHQRPEVVIEITLQSLHMPREGTLQAQSQISILSKGKILAQNNLSFAVPIKDASPAAHVDAFSDLCAQLSEAAAQLLL